MYEERSTTTSWTISCSPAINCTLVLTFTCALPYIHLNGPRWLIPRSEDFGLPNARRLLDKYRPEIACFNDDIQGTGCVTLAAIMAGLHVAKLKLADIRLVIFGSGTAGTGIADQVRDAIATESRKSQDDAAKQIW